MTNAEAEMHLKPGTPVQYTPWMREHDNDGWFNGVVDEEPRMLGDTMVVRLREMEPRYGVHTSRPGRTGIAAAAVTHVRLGHEAAPPTPWVCPECGNGFGHHEHCSAGVFPGAFRRQP